MLCAQPGGNDGRASGWLVSEAREVAMVARSRDVSLDEATEIIETYARVVAPEALAKRTIKVYDEILAKLASAANAPFMAKL
jgi:hypothetical protein